MAWASNLHLFAIDIKHMAPVRVRVLPTLVVCVSNNLSHSGIGCPAAHRSQIKHTPVRWDRVVPRFTSAHMLHPCCDPFAVNSPGNSPRLATPARTAPHPTETSYVIELKHDCNPFAVDSPTHPLTRQLAHPLALSWQATRLFSVAFSRIMCMEEDASEPHARIKLSCAWPAPHWDGWSRACKGAMTSTSI